jgi:hypothetical protein
MKNVTFFQNKSMIMKPAVFSQVYIHFVFSPRGREALIREEIQPEECNRYAVVIVLDSYHSTRVDSLWES